MDDILIVGSGIAALQLARHISTDRNVKIITKGRLTEANSYLAQGGVAAAIDSTDDSRFHVADTLMAGAGHNQKKVVREIIDAGPSLINELAGEGIFDRSASGELTLGLEAAHGRPRIVHAGGDATGKYLMEYFLNHLTENIEIMEDTFVFSLIVDDTRSHCIGVKTKDRYGDITYYYGSAVILATGGLGQLYAYTSNAKTITGDGIAMAYMAGAEIADAEFIQFHPTLLYKDGKTHGLISEAVRGEGGLLVTEDGRQIMKDVHELADLAPRYIVAQTIFNYFSRGEQIYLNILGVNDFERRFPNIAMNCREQGIDLEKGLIPVVPGCHFFMGGIKTNTIGQTSIKGLFAIGETAHTGLHGANRLASNSLLEGLFQGKMLAKWLNDHPESIQIPVIDEHKMGETTTVKLPPIHLLQKRMLECVGIIRDKERLEEQQRWLGSLELEQYTSFEAYSISDITAIFMYMNAILITNAALLRKESRGAHLRSDYPEKDDMHWNKVILIKKVREKMHFAFEERAREFVWPL